MELRRIEYNDVDHIVACLQDMRKEIPLCAESEDDPAYVSNNLQYMVSSDAFIGHIYATHAFIIGSVSANWYDKRLKAYEQLLYVAPSLRKTSLGSRLITEFCKSAKEKGACEIIAGTSLGYRTESVVRLYEYKGFKNIGTTLKLNIE